MASSLVPDYDSASSESENEHIRESSSKGTDDKETVEEEDKMEKDKLPKPVFDDQINSTVLHPSGSSSGSVFANPFRAAEIIQNSLLEKHVKMTTPTNQMTVLNGRQICWNYRKGRCRFGHKCKFAHDSDIPTSNRPEVTTAQEQGDYTLQDSLDEAGSKSDVGKKKKRPGLSQGILPSKKIIKSYYKQKNLDKSQTEILSQNK
ncbi:uncharacterized protein LOC106466311 [Limulus polyphemus]|uniref:Uncharacterized protein LOC106466311 n=1 Tax=Limulus polyphemus TaxID=6850 RepID=A0ABM1BHE0_LIMPO|nr:uncharacterized protein LOC106466311 [Limulus polyphemus]